MELRHVLTLVHHLKAFDPTEGSTENSKLVFGVEAEVWTELQLIKSASDIAGSSKEPNASWRTGMMMDNSTNLILDGFETRHVTV